MVNETIEILKFLISNKKERFSIRKISKIRKINYKSAYNSLKFLEKEKIATLERVGNTIICSFNNKFNDLVFKAEYLRRGEILKNKDFLIAYNRLADLKFSFIALLFGSYADGTATKHSDIDLLTIGGDEKEIKRVISIFPEKIHLTSV
ncbi:MAG: nucleotidyltransferase domain-containing protein, partial [Nanoarchaeota archaeon]